MQDHNRRFKFIFGLGKGFTPTRLIISIFHRLIGQYDGQYFESRILFISLANLHGGKRWLDVWERRRQAPLYPNQTQRWYKRLLWSYIPIPIFRRKGANIVRLLAKGSFKPKDDFFRIVPFTPSLSGLARRDKKIPDSKYWPPECRREGATETIREKSAFG